MSVSWAGSWRTVWDSHRNQARKCADECRRCDAVIAAASSLDETSTSRDFSLRWILMHLVEETARHLDHIDLSQVGAKVTLDAVQLA